MLRFITSSTSWFSTRLRAQLVAKASSSVRPKPSSRNESTMRLRRRRRYRVGLRRAGAVGVAGVMRGRAGASGGGGRLRRGDAVADAVAGLDQLRGKWFVDHLAQSVDVHAQRVRIGQLLAPHPRLQFLSRD